MRGGRERNILRWDLHTDLLRAKLQRVEAELASAGEATGSKSRARLEKLAAERTELRDKLRALGPTPRAKMG